jgi:protein disulfide-isomerase
MKRHLWSLLAALVLVQAGAAEPKWGTNLEQAQAQAKAENKLVFLLFTGSDWCSGCKMLARDVLSKPEFATYAEQNLVLVEADFPMRKKQDPALTKANEALMEKFGIEGFPTVVVFSGTGKRLGTTVGYDGGGTKSMIRKLDRYKKL